MKKLRVLLVLALALSMALASTSLAFAQYGPFHEIQEGEGVIAGNVDVVRTDEFSFELTGNGTAQICFNPDKVSTIFVNGSAVATYTVGTAVCTTVTVLPGATTYVTVSK